MTRLAFSLACMLALVSCRGQGSNVVLASLDRSEKIGLLCADVEQSTGNLYDFFGTLPLALCEEDGSLSDDANAQLLGAVTQVASGTVAVVNFSNNTIFDTNVTVPGVTALRVGEQPTAIQISDVDSRYTYVSSFSPQSVQAIPTREVITGSALPPDDDAPALERQELRLDAGPTDLALYELATFQPVTENGEVVGARTTVIYRYLFAALPALGQVVQMEVQVDNATGAQTFGEITAFDLPAYDCESVTPVVPPASDANDYNRICPEDFDNRGEGRFIKTVRTTVPCREGRGDGPMPFTLTIDRGNPSDPEDDVLLVSDANQPVIHRFTLSPTGGVETTPVVTLAPTNDLAVTPFVPASSDPSDRAATLRYLYAVSAADGSVLAVDYTDSSSTFGAVLPVLAGITARANEENVESRNRVRSSFSNARAIEVLTPFYDLETDPETGGLRIPDDDPETNICDPNDDDAFALAQNPRNMRGVFLGVSLSNGTLFFLDIYDLNAPCRGGQGAVACTLAETGPDRFASIRRHRRRFGFTPTTFVSIDGTPSLQFNAAPGGLSEINGQAINSDGPGLAFIECPASMINVFGVPPSGSDADGLICASSQVWSSFTQRWDARWQGLIPQSEGGLGLFADASFEGEPGNWFLAGDVPFCSVGVLGEQGGTPSDTGLSIDQLAGYAGDRLVITGELPPNTEDDPNCEQFVDLLEDIDDRQVWFPIRRAFNDELQIGPAPATARYSLDDVRACFNQLTQYQIHTRGVYTVTGNVTGFINRIVANENGECVFDEDRPVVADDVDTFLTGRAFAGTQFINPLVSFEIQDFPVSPTDATVALLNFNILNQFGTELLDTGGSVASLPASMLFSSENDQLFFIDFQAGVRQIIFDPLNIVQTFR